MKRQPYWLLSLVCTLSLFQAGHAAGQDLNATLRQLTDIEADAEQIRRAPLRPKQGRSRTHVEERLTDGELFLRLSDYVRASIIFTDIVESYPQHSAYPDALFLLGESLFKAGEHYGARTRYRKIIDRADETAFRPYVQRALGRLIEIAIHLSDFEGVDAYFARLGRLPASEIEASTHYFRAKYLYSVAVREGENARGEVASAKVDADKLEQARAAFAVVGEGTPYSAQARYFIGVIHVVRGQLEPAVEAFNVVSRIKPENEEQRQILGLAQIALGRLHYERDKLQPAIDAYQTVQRSSPLFDTALYEIAWVYIRMGDGTRAERSLELLSIATPDSRHIPDGKLLRGNLLLRDGDFDTATSVFDDVSAQFTPVRDELDRVLAQHEDAAAYFQQLVRSNLEAFDASTFLPPQALRWAGTEGDMQRAMGTLGDLSQSRQLVAETEALVVRLRTALSTPNPVSVFADSRAHREGTVGLRNRLSRAQKTLLAADSQASSGYSSAELDQVRARRRDLERALGGAPGGQKDVERRRMARVGEYIELSKELSRFEVDLMGMEARITATEHYLEDTRKARDTAVTEAVLVELTAQRAAVAQYRRNVQALELQIESGRLQAGVGDQDSQREEDLRKEYSELVERERRLLKALGARPNPQIDAAFRRVAAVGNLLDVEDNQVDVIVADRVRDMRVVLDEESAKLVGYRTQLATLEGESEVVVGGIALENYKQVRQRFYDLVLRADVGGIDVSWAIREEHRARGESLSRQRARDLKALEDEFRDIMDQREAAP